MDSSEKQPNPREGVLRRLRRTFGRRRPPDPSIAAVMAQWAEYELIFNDILQRLNAQLARQAKYEKAALTRLAAEGGAGPGDNERTETAAPILSPKQALRSAHANRLFGGRVQAILAAKEARNVDASESG